METHINAGTFQEYDYNNEYSECEWKENSIVIEEYNHCVVNDCTHDWGG